MATKIFNKIHFLSKNTGLDANSMNLSELYMFRNKGINVIAWKESNGEVTIKKVTKQKKPRN